MPDPNNLPPLLKDPSDVTLSRIGRYVLRREIGRGYSSVVFEALDTSNGNSVAFKLLMPPPGMSEARRTEMIERFAREARAVAALSHPAIVSVREAGHDAEGRPFLTMELLRGETLRARLAREGALPPEEAVAITLRLAEGLHHAHQRGIVHRDVKPDNVFLLEDGQAKLMDFGVAQMLADGAITQTGTVVGSPAYMSPEQIMGGRLDARSDVFSLGVTLAEMVTGRKPFDAPTIPAVMHRILYRAPDLAHVQPRALRPVLDRALARRGAARFPDMTAFSDILRERVVPRLPDPSAVRLDWRVAPPSLLPGRQSGPGDVTHLGGVQSGGGTQHARAARMAWRSLLAAGVLALAAAIFVLNGTRHTGSSEIGPPAPPPRSAIPAARVPNSAGQLGHIPLTWHREKTSATVLPRHISSPLPLLPAEADAADWDGVVIVRAQVNADGRVQKVTLTGPSGLPSVDQAAVQAVRGWRYTSTASGSNVTERVTFSGS